MKLYGLVPYRVPVETDFQCFYKKYIANTWFTCNFLKALFSLVFNIVDTGTGFEPFLSD